ncbi:MAG TPA: bis(5'-nucleosyl)-tetraphosphatase (symmetrical) YqeK [Planktothrix sp.]|jgi:predicted HD superfamily hydrolase involved in NAD metabolism
MANRNGIPAKVTIESARQWVKPRVTEKRFKHIAGVAQVARELAEAADCDVFIAELAGWLHDACKEFKDKKLVAHAREFGMVLHPIEETNGHLLHGPVAALVARDELGITNKVLLNAVAEHTLGALNMTPMSQILFLADCLECSRSDDFTVPIWRSLGYDVAEGAPQKRKLKRKLDLEAGMLTACDLSLGYLLADGKSIHPKTVDVRNFFLQKLKERSKTP